MIWSDDESKFHLFGSDGRVHVKRRVCEDFLPECVGTEQLNLEVAML